TRLLTTPISLHGFGLPSIQTINDVAALNGIRRDVNHFLPLFKGVASISLTDWACSYNMCMPPTLLLPSSQSLAHLKNKIPSAWRTACEVLTKLNLLLFPTDFTDLLAPNTALEHFANVVEALSSYHEPPSLNITPTHTLNITPTHTLAPNISPGTPTIASLNTTPTTYQDPRKSG
ncbi:hypothetical protein H0H92_000404, partial [Tricholoma furcatifolium]